MTVAADTMTLIWGIKSPGAKPGNPRQQDLAEMQCRAHILLDILERQKATIIIPSVSVAELLVGVAPAQHANFLAEIQKRFRCPSFDLPASQLAAWLWLEHRKLPAADQLQRTVLKSDVMIIATAKVAGASDFYSDEAKCRKLAKLAGMEPRELPTHHPDVFMDLEFRKQFGLNKDDTYSPGLSGDN